MVVVQIQTTLFGRRQGKKKYRNPAASDLIQIFYGGHVESECSGTPIWGDIVHAGINVSFGNSKAMEFVHFSFHHRDELCCVFQINMHFTSTIPFDDFSMENMNLKELKSREVFNRLRPPEKQIEDKWARRFASHDISGPFWIMGNNLWGRWEVRHETNTDGDEMDLHDAVCAERIL